MTIKTLVVALIATLTLISASASSLTQEKALEIVSPFYGFLSGTVSADDARKSFSKDWKSQSGHGDNEYKGMDKTIGAISGFFRKAVPNLKWEIREALVSGDRVIILGEATGIPAGKKFMGVPVVKGKSFRIMSIDVHTIKDGKVVKTYHVENWVGAIKQLSPKKKSKH